MGYLSAEDAERVLKPEIMTQPGFTGSKEG
jgi:hypothetical protein